MSTAFSVGAGRSLSMQATASSSTRVTWGEASICLERFQPVDGFDLEPACAGAGLRAVVAMPPTHYLLLPDPGQRSCELLEVTTGPYALAWYDAKGALIDERDVFLDGGDETLDVPGRAVLGALRRSGR
ncbi:MAG: hypothetical protein AAGI01_07075 [Myxococcota bacterium]